MNEAEASWFITETCQMLPKSFSATSDHTHDLKESWNPYSNEYTLLCGSNAEFYIRPLNKCISDADMLTFQGDELAFTDDFPELPKDISSLGDTIKCFMIESYKKYPGFVRLRVIGEMSYDWKYKKYEFNQVTLPNRYKKIDMANYFYTKVFSHYERKLRATYRGPSVTCKNEGPYPVDLVQCVWCPQWPNEAQNWPHRRRDHGWPTGDTIFHVVQNGCHIVYVQHRSCRDEALQWRLSFSVAEVNLLQSWTKIQQIVYHLLRFLAKRELIQKDCPKEDEVLCTYHLKTLMLWTCEEMSPEWWTSSSVIAICCNLLRKLSEWLQRMYCPNYFIPEANLFNHPLNSKVLQETEARLRVFRKPSIVCHWFVENYILPYVEELKKRRRLSLVKNIVDYVIPLFIARNLGIIKSESLDMMFTSRDFSGRYINATCDISGLTEDNFRHLPTIENISCFHYYDNALYILHAVNRLSWEVISLYGIFFYELLKHISMRPKIVRSQYHNFPKPFRAERCWFEFLRAQDVMQNLTGLNGGWEFQLLSVMSKQFLLRALKCDSPNCSFNAPAAWAYIAALQFATSEYPMTRFLCFAILKRHTSHEEEEPLNAGCLLFIDDVVRIIGLFLIHKKITESKLPYIGRLIYLDLRLSSKVVAHHLNVLSAERMTTHFDLHHDLIYSVFFMDEYLMALTKHKCTVLVRSFAKFNAARQIVYQSTESLTEAQSVNHPIAKKTGILMECALENMASFYSAIRRDFGIKCNTVDCYRALYLYNCRLYDEVLHLCEGILQEPDLQSHLKKFAFANVLIIPPLDSILDRDVQSLLGFHTLFHYLPPLNDDVCKCEPTAIETFSQWFVQNINRDREELSLSLRQLYSIKCHYFIGRHFLAKYLKVRCYIDCNLPYSEALTEFSAHKNYLPFEHIVQTFLLQKLRLNRKLARVDLPDGLRGTPH